MLDLEKIDLNLEKMQQAGASKEEMQQYIALEEQNARQISEEKPRPISSEDPFAESPIAFEPPELEPSKVMGSVNKGIARIGGPFSGAVETGMRKAGIYVPEEEPETVGEHVATGIGEAAGFLIPAGTATKLLSRGTGLIADISKTIINSLSKHPILATGSEVTGGAFMGIGRKVEQEHPEYGPMPSMVGGFVGGGVPGMVAYAPSRIASKGVQAVLGKLAVPFSKSGSEYRAGEYLKGLAVSPEGSITKASEESIGDIPRTLATGEKRVIALYRQLVSKDPVTESEAVDKITESIFKLENELKKLGEGSPEILEDLIQRRISALDISMDQRILKSMEKAQDALDALPVAQRKAQESIIVRDSLEKLSKEEYQKVSDIWKQVPKDIEVNPTLTRSTYDNLLAETSEAQLEDFPNILKKSFILKRDAAKPEYSQNITINEMQGLRSKLLEIERNARAINNPKRNLNTARIAGKMADAILEDIDATALDSGEETLKAALNATRKYKEKFEKGIVGKVLGKDRTSTQVVEPEVTLDVATAGKPGQAALNIDKLAITPEGKGATERYLGRTFADKTIDTRTGKIVPSRAEKQMSENEALLDRFPSLRGKIQTASELEKSAKVTETLLKDRKAKLQNPKISVASNFLKADLNKKIPTILNSSNPVAASRQLVKMASKDKSGNALKGLKAGFVDHILGKAQTGDYSEAGKKLLSGKALRNYLVENKQVLNQVFTKEEISRMDKIANELSKIDIFRTDKTKVEEFGAKDYVSNFLIFLSRYAGAQAGAKMKTGTIQVPGYVAERFKGIMGKLNLERGSQLVADAILSDDPKLFKTLMLPIDKPTSKVTMDNLKLIEQRLNAWLMGEGNRVLQDINKENK